jgi:hypothetical protein
VETSVLNNGFGGSANNVTLQYLTVEEFADNAPYGAIGAPQGADSLTQEINWTVENCEVKLNHAMGVRVGYGIQVLNNYVHNNGEGGVAGGIGDATNPVTESTNSGILIQGNVINSNNYAHFDPGFGAGGFKVGSTSGIVLRGNIIQQNEGAGIHFDSNSQNEFVDGNLITDNADADGLEQEISYGNSTFRNNVVLRNGLQVENSNQSYQIAVRASAGVEAYCNVMEVPNGADVAAWGIDADNRGNSVYPPFQYLTASGNYMHHNTAIWDSDNGVAGYSQNDPQHQPNFFAVNTPPDFNTYHQADLTKPNFIYDNNDSGQNSDLTFAQYQANGADAHGTSDANNSSGFPAVAITAPADQSSFTGGATTVAATASDPSGISKVEFYVDWTLATTLSSSPYNFNWSNAPAGAHTVAAMAYSNAGIRACYAVTLTAQ